MRWSVDVEVGDVQSSPSGDRSPVSVDIKFIVVFVHVYYICSASVSGSQDRTLVQYAEGNLSGEEGSSKQWKGWGGCFSNERQRISQTRIYSCVHIWVYISQYPGHCNRGYYHHNDVPSVNTCNECIMCREGGNTSYIYTIPSEDLG